MATRGDSAASAGQGRIVIATCMAAPIGMALSSISMRLEWFGAGCSTPGGTVPRYIIDPVTRCKTNDQSSAAMTGNGEVVAAPVVTFA